ncbi:2-hydroxyacyl-CoA dehydratase family protein [Acetobacterium malicum]|uniref:2-hydroxyacyl-CoA dehydratase family protein n=1 Tax=Acetobacterium malicum TaxID=52692 RepID=UPI000417F947|nr:2-hydroxyacyl-CoA dehydratase family protein [Acetobacterium dehalogenans]
MKDLKHIHYFTALLEDANNELVRAAKKDGGIAVGYTCYYIPEALLNVGNAFSVRLRAPKTGSLDISQYYMGSMNCSYVRALLERAFEGGYHFLDAFFSSETCQQMNRLVENIYELKLIDNGTFYHSIIDAPLKISPHGIKHYTNQIRTHFLEPLRDQFGIDISETALRNAVAEHNRMCAIFEEISELRKADNPGITATEFHILNLVSYSCPTGLILPYLEETLVELKKRKLDPKIPYRARVVVVGSEMDDYGFTELIEYCGAYVVADRYCFGSMPGRQQIPINDDEDIVEVVCRFYLETNQCPRFMSQEKVQERRDVVKALYDEYNADGIIYEQMKFCDYWGYERAVASFVLHEEMGIPTVALDREYTVQASGQLRTRVQAFVESLEIKKIQKAKNQNEGEKK